MNAAHDPRERTPTHCAPVFWRAFFFWSATAPGSKVACASRLSGVHQPHLVNVAHRRADFCSPDCSGSFCLAFIFSDKRRVADAGPRYRWLVWSSGTNA